MLANVKPLKRLSSFTNELITAFGLYAQIFFRNNLLIFVTLDMQFHANLFVF